MDQSASDVPGSNSGQFRSRATASVSQRRLNASTSQTREPSGSPTRLESFNEGPFVAPLHESFPSHINDFLWSLMSSIMRQRWLFHIVAVACTISFTYDMVFGKGGPFSGQTTRKYHLSPLNALSQPFRISRIADLHDPSKFEPFVISPTEDNETALNMTACLCIAPEQLGDIAQYTDNWPGFISIVLVHPDEMSSPARRALKGQLRSLVRHEILRRKLYLHLFAHKESVPPPFNSLMNLARFYAPTEPNLLVPFLSLLPALSKRLATTGDFLGTLNQTSIVFLGEDAARTGNGEFEASTALLLSKSKGPWCPERFISVQETQWKQCIWRAWLLSLGDFHFFSIPNAIDAKELYRAAPALARDHILERIDQIMIPKFRSETCIHVSRNSNALRMKEGALEAPLSHPFLLQHEWLRGACAEAFDAWGDVFV